MNGARSPEPYLYIVLRFGVDVTYGQLEIFREALLRYVEARPRDWAKVRYWKFSRVENSASSLPFRFSSIILLPFFNSYGVSVQSTFARMQDMWNVSLACLSSVSVSSRRQFLTSLLFRYGLRRSSRHLAGTFQHMAS